MDVVRNEAAGRFEIALDGDVAFAEYRLEPGAVVFPHTVVPEAFAGKGVAGKLAETALGWARAEGRKVKPTCSFFAAYIKRHAEYQDLLADGFREKLGLA
jgi:predicted GNAT family acetyltransferase